MPTVDEVQLDGTTYDVGGDVTFDEIAPITGPATPLPVMYGGTGANDASDARENINAVGFMDTSNITRGTISASGSTSYTATSDCVFYIIWEAQANVNLVFSITLNGVLLFYYSSNAAIQNTVSIVPFYLKKSDVLQITQDNNKASNYFVVGMR